MGLLNSELSILHFDDTYWNQKHLQQYHHDSIDFRNMRHVNLYCEKESLLDMEQTLEKKHQNGITFIGSGNYHYVTYLLLKQITKPFTLVLFDNHPDLQIRQNQCNEIISCGTWVSFAIKDIPFLERVIMIGPTVDLKPYSPHPFTVIYPFGYKHNFSIKSILSAIHSQNIYISIDKDVLNTSEASTNWDQGAMDLPTLTYYLHMFLNERKVQGVDICGELPLSPLEAILPEQQAMIQKNEKVNQLILQTCLHSSYSAHIRGA